MEPTNEQKALFLKSRGWNETHEIKGFKMWVPDNGKILPMSLMPAYAFEMMEFKNEVRKEIVNEGKKPISCNKCGRNTAIFEGDHFCGYYGLIHASFTTGYNSYALPDLNKYTFSLCEDCVKDLMDSFSIQPEIEHSL